MTKVFVMPNMNTAARFTTELAIRRAAKVSPLLLIKPKTKFVQTLPPQPPTAA